MEKSNTNINIPSHLGGKNVTEFLEEQTTTIQVPGKLMIAGEYAILEPETSGIVLAVNRYINVKVTPSKEYAILSSLQDTVLKWEYDKKHGVNFKNSETTSPFIPLAVDIAFQYLKIMDIPFTTFYMEITSQLDDEETGKKYGLGSSAAIVVGVITAILDYFKALEKTSLETRFCLCAIAHLKAQGSGSCADIAACVYGGWVWFRSFSVAWLLDKIHKGEGIEEIIKSSWQGLKIIPLTPPADLYFYAGWTKEVAKTPNMINRVLEFKQQNPESYKSFLSMSNDATAKMIQGFLGQNTNEIINGIGKNREALLYLGQESGVEIETKELRTLCKIGDIYGKSKPSGAGGGDCGIVLTNQEVKAILWTEWEKEGIQPLNLASENMHKNRVVQ